jgi:hypothetical protein
MIRRPALLLRALALAAALAASPAARAASCCGGGGGGGVVLPRAAWWMVDVAADYERYDGFWDGSGSYFPDPAGTRLQQWRATLSLAGRLFPGASASLSLPWAWNANRFTGIDSHTSGPGDTTLAFWWEALDEKTAWRMRDLSDLVPNLTIGPSLTIPTGVSPYDEVENSFDVTGRGFYRLDGNLQVDKGYRAFSAALAFSYGFHFARPVNRFYGKLVEPFRRNLGDRLSASATLGYRYVLRAAGDSVTANLTYAFVHEGEGVKDGAPDPTFAMRKHSLGASFTYASTDHPWSARASWTHAFQRAGWGENFPVTDVVSLGVRYAY